LRKRIAPVSLALLGGAGLLWVRQAQPQSCVVQDGCDAGYFYRFKAGFEPAPARRLRCRRHGGHRRLRNCRGDCGADFPFRLSAGAATPFDLQKAIAT